MKTPSNKVMTIALVLLLLVNVAMLVFMLKGRPHRNGRMDNNHQPVFEMMSKELNMTDQQKTDFKKMREEHFAAIKPVFDSIRTLKKSLFNLIRADNVNDSTINYYSMLIAAQQSIIDKMTISHFRKVRALFTGDQQKKYDDFVEKMYMQRHLPRTPQNRGNDSSK